MAYEKAFMEQVYIFIKKTAYFFMLYPVLTRQKSAFHYPFQQ